MNTEQPGLARTLGSRDLSIFLIAALVNLNSVPVVAGIGPAALAFWVFGFLLFFLPQAVAVLELSTRFPQEGGIYQWTKRAFGDFHGFVSGWCYWTNNIFYIPTLLFYIVGFAAYLGGESTAVLGENPVVMAVVSLSLLWFITWLNIRGLDVGKWVQNVGVAGTFLITAIVLVIGYLMLQSRGSANVISASSLVPVFEDWRIVGLMSVVCLNYVGLELGSVIGGEVKNPRRSIPRAVLVAGVVTVTLYLLCTLALQLTIPASDIGVIDGILQGVERAATAIQLPWLVVPVALLMILNASGNTSAWLAGSSRIPFVIGIDRYLPPALGRLHPRHATPYVALIVQAFASSLFIVISSVGATVHEMYMVLLQTTVILQLIPYLYMFLALLRFGRGGSQNGAEVGFFRWKKMCGVAGVLGLAMTAAGVAFAFIPSTSVQDIWNFELKTILGTLSFLIPAVFLFRVNLRKFRVSEPLPESVEVQPD